MPLAGRPLLVPEGRYLLKSSVRLTGTPVMVVGAPARDGYLREVGQVRDHEHEFTPVGFRRMADEAEAALGDRYAILLAADERGRQSRTPPPRRHRLLELIAYAREAAAEMENSKAPVMTVYGDLLSELVTTVSLLSRWQNHPLAPALAATLGTEDEGHHTVMLLAVASYLVDARNGVGLVSTGSEGRIPDIWTEPSLVERLDVEVKAPKDLRGPRPHPVDAAEAERLVERIVKKAASATGGQLDPEGSGVLAIGGFHLGAGSLDMLERAATGVLQRQADRKKHLAGVILTELSYEITEGDGGEHVAKDFSPILATRFVRHPGYRGDLNIARTHAPEIPPPQR
jgi:hypothetical protein